MLSKCIEELTLDTQGMDKFIKIKKAVHDGTLKIYVYGKQIFDITMMNSTQYNKLLKYL